MAQEEGLEDDEAPIENWEQPKTPKSPWKVGGGAPKAKKIARPVSAVERRALREEAEAVINMRSTRLIRPASAMLSNQKSVSHGYWDDLLVQSTPAGELLELMNKVDEHCSWMVPSIASLLLQVAYLMHSTGNESHSVDAVAAARAVLGVLPSTASVRDEKSAALFSICKAAYLNGTDPDLSYLSVIGAGEALQIPDPAMQAKSSMSSFTRSVVRSVEDSIMLSISPDCNPVAIGADDEESIQSANSAGKEFNEERRRRVFLPFFRSPHPGVLPYGAAAVNVKIPFIRDVFPAPAHGTTTWQLFGAALGNSAAHARSGKHYLEDSSSESVDPFVETYHLRLPFAILHPQRLAGDASSTETSERATRARALRNLLGVSVSMYADGKLREGEPRAAMQAIEALASIVPERVISRSVIWDHLFNVRLCP